MQSVSALQTLTYKQTILFSSEKKKNIVERNQNGLTGFGFNRNSLTCFAKKAKPESGLIPNEGGKLGK